MFEQVLTKEALGKAYVDEGLTKREVARQFRTTVTTLNKYLKRYGIETKPAWAYRGADLAGKRFGRLVVTERAASDRHCKSAWKCRCDCGNSKVIASASLIRGLTLSCGCYASEMAHKGHMELSASYWRRQEQSAAQRGIEFTITQVDVWRTYEAQGRRCAYTGLPVVFYRNSNRAEHQTASIDRIDSCGGYTPDNIQIVHKTINLMKNYLSDGEFVALCNLVANNRKMSHEDCVNQAARTILRKTRHRS